MPNPDLSQSVASGFAAREAALDRINDDPAWAQRAYGAKETAMADDKIAVPSSTMRNVNEVIEIIKTAERCLDRAAEIIKPLAPRLHTLADYQARAANALACDVEALKAGMEVTEHAYPSHDRHGNAR